MGSWVRRGLLGGAVLVALVVVVAIAVEGPGHGASPQADGSPSASAVASPTAGDGATGTDESPTTKVYFNNPWSSRDQDQYRLQDVEVQAIQDAPRGATIYAATYSIGSRRVGDALVAAYRRGVRVRLNVDSHATYTQTARLQKLLGTDQGKDSYMVRCYLACASDVTYPTRDGKGITKPYQHAKFMAISQTGSQQYVVMVTSENLSSAVVEQSNDLIVLSGSKIAYDFVESRFLIMQRDSGGAYGQVSTGDATLTMYPVVLASGQEPAPDLDPYWHFFNNITCQHEGRATELRIAMSMFSLPRLYLAEQLAQLGREGCRITIIGQPNVPDGGWDPEVKAALLVAGSGIELRQTTGGKWVHSKVVTVDGWDGDGNPLRLAWTNNANWLLQGLYYNDEIGVVTTDQAIVDAYDSHLDGLLTRHSKRVTR